MASYEKLHDSELEAGRTMDQHNDDVVVVDDKGRSEELSSSEDSNRRPMSPLKRAFAVVFIFAFIGFSLLRGVALVSVHCISSKYSQLGSQPELMEDEAFMEALRSISPEEYCKLYAEYCPDKTEPAMDTWEKVEAIDEVTVDLTDAEPTIKASLDKRQDTGGNGTVSEIPSTSIPSSSSSESTNPPTSNVETSSTTEAPPPPVTTSSTQPPPPPSTTSTSTQDDDDDETSTTSQPQTSEPVTTSSVESTSTTSERTSSADEDETSSTPQSSSSRRTVTSGTITTTSAERVTYTSTLADGGATVITSTTWVEFVPEETAQSENDPNLQGSASGWQRNTYLQVVMGVLVGGILMI